MKNSKKAAILCGFMSFLTTIITAKFLCNFIVEAIQTATTDTSPNTDVFVLFAGVTIVLVLAGIFFLTAEK